MPDQQTDRMDRCWLCGEIRAAHTKSKADWRDVPGCTGLFPRTWTEEDKIRVNSDFDKVALVAVRGEK